MLIPVRTRYYISTNNMRLLRLPKLPRLNIRAFFTLAALSTALYAGLLYIQKQQLIVLAQDSGSSQKYTTAAGDGKSLRCDGFTITEVAADGTTKALEDCSQKQQTCYVWNDTVKQQYAGTCLYNPPVASFPGGAGCPSTEQIKANKDPMFGGSATQYTCKYFNPSIDIFDTNLPQSGIEAYISKYASQFRGSNTEFRRRVELIVSKSKSAGLNPALLLGYWKSESAFGETLGCLSSSASGFDNQVECALGNIPGGAVIAPCARSHDANSAPCRALSDIRIQHPDVYKDFPITLPIRTFDDFAEAYGSKSPALVKYQPTPDGINRNCLHSYNTILEAALEVGACKAPGSGSGGNTTNLSCPIPTGTVLTGSKYNPIIFGPELKDRYPPESGHCGPGYDPGGGDQCTASYKEGTFNAIDVYADPIVNDVTDMRRKNDFAQVYFPNIKGHTAEYSLVYNSGESGNQTIYGYAVTDLTSGEKYYIQFHHSDPHSAVQQGKSGDKAVRVCGNGCNVFHSHIQIQTGSSLNAGRWLDATQFFCRDNTRYTHYKDVTAGSSSSGT